MLRDLQASLSEFVRPRDLSVGQRLGSEPDDGNDDIAAQLEALDRLVGASRSAIQALAATVKEHEESVSDLKNRLSDEAAQKDEARQQSDKFEAAIRIEEQRTAAADARTKSAEEKFKSLREREAAVRERIDRLTANVAALAATKQFKSPPIASGRVSPNGAADRAS
jgi:chromosome segregation ATPase